MKKIFRIFVAVILFATGIVCTSCKGKKCTCTEDGDTFTIELKGTPYSSCAEVNKYEGEFGMWCK